MQERPQHRPQGVAGLAPLLQAAQAARLFSDSKTLVDMPLAAAPDRVAAAFGELQLPDASQQPEQHRAALAQFCQQWLLPAESDLRAACLPQLEAGPPLAWLPLVTCPEMRIWAEHLRCTWGELCRQATPEVAAHPDRHTLLVPAEAAGGGTAAGPSSPPTFVVPGARFREMYYWDTFWSLRGILVCGFLELAQGILSSMLAAVEQYGYMPNGLRSYYLNRSQPPLLSQMVAAVHGAAPDRALLERALPALVREHAYWTTGPKQVVLVGRDGARHCLSRYWAAWDQPRPESYREDVATATGLDDAMTRTLWRELASAAESGWDFSSRWLADGTSLRSCRTTRVVPADLNGLLHQMERNIAGFAAELGHTELAAEFAQHAQQRLQAMQALLWDAGGGQWRDLIMSPDGYEHHPDQAAGAAAEAYAATAASFFSEGPSLECSSFQHSSVVSASNWLPLYCGCAPAGSPQAAAAVASLQCSGLLQAAGVAVTLAETGQQWDWPNSWPPVTCMLLEGCQQYGGERGVQLAAELAQQYLHTAHAAWQQTGRMFEKFDALHRGAPGGGGEYEVVHGFGWTNGVALLLMERYGWQGGSCAGGSTAGAAG